MLPFVAILLTALFGVAALVIDLGIAGASRLEIENAADAAILGADVTPLFEEARRSEGRLAERGLAQGLALPRAVTGPDGSRGFERTVPWIFGRGSSVGGAAPDLDVRVLRRERALLAVRVGVARGMHPGRADIAVDVACWAAGAEALVFTHSAEAGEMTLLSVDPSEAAPDPACRSAEAAIALKAAREVQWIGDRIGSEIEVETAQAAGLAAGVAYVPLFTGDERRLIAFARAALTTLEDGSLRVTPLASGSTRNASALLVSTARDVVHDERIALALADRNTWLDDHPAAAATWIAAPVLAGTP